MALRFLVIEGNAREARERHRQEFGLTPGQSYGRELMRLAPGSQIDLVCPADEGAALPDGAGLESYDGAVTTGSGLHAHHATPAVTRQVDLHRALFAARTPHLGSCWGLQIAALAAGGDVRANPAGWETGFARNIAPTSAGRAHPLLAGRPAAFDAPANHLDAVTTLPPDITILASNALAAVQAAEIRHLGGVFWGMQYHPEFSLAELIVIMRRVGPALIAQGFFRDAMDHAAYLADLDTLARDTGRSDLAWRFGLDAQVLDDGLRATELRNFIAHAVRPAASARGRA